MYVPNSFAETDLSTLHDFIEVHSFATLASNHQELTASHLPLLLDRDRGTQGTLIGHVARANPQWRLAEGHNVLAIFHGPHTYVSPTWYDSVNVVPTWNYVTVHAYGKMRLESDHQRLVEILKRSVEFYESAMPNPWSPDQTDAGFIDGLMDGIVGFEIVIDRLEGKWKLNQNHDRARRERVVHALREGGSEDQQQIADLMARRLENP